MVNPQIGIGNGTSGRTSSYDAVDLHEDSPASTSATAQRFEAQRRATAATSTTEYTIDSDDDSSDSNGSSEEEHDESSSDSEDESSSEDEDLSEDDDEKDVKMMKTNNINNTNSGHGDINSVAATEVMSNLLKNSSAQQPSTSSRSLSSRPGTLSKRRSIIPPASSFKNIGQKFPSYMLKGSKRAGGKDKLGKHKRLSTVDQDEDEDHDDEDDEESHPTKKIFMENPINKVRDPSQFPMEQYTDKKYGQDFGSYTYTTSYSSADPSNVNYEPQPLRRMEVDLSNGMEEKKRKIVFYGFLTAIFICFCIAVGSIITHASRHHVLSPPPSLANVCAMSNISTRQGHEQCEKLCEEAKCCMAPGINSCFEGQEEVCRMYSPCAALYSTNSDSNTMHAMVPPAPVNLPQLCSIESITFVSGYIECNAACQAGLCCTVPDMEGSSLAAAGLVDLSNLPTSCVNTHPDVCAEYSPCDALRDAKDAHGKPNDIVNSKCTAIKMQTEIGIDECEKACQPRSCCFAHSSKRNCYDDNQVWCDEFHACNILTDEDYDPLDDIVENDDDQADPSVTERCQKDFRTLSSNEVSMCKTICEPISCCFYEDVGCSRDIDCNLYSFCSSFLQFDLGYIDIGLGPGDENIDEILPPSGGQHSPGPSQEEVEKACLGINSRRLLTLHPFHQIHCGQLCSNYMCCFGDDFDPASCHEVSTCQKYEACKELIAYDNKKDGSTDNASPPNLLCSIDNLSKVGGFTQCEEHCADHMCCFSADGCNDNQQCADHEHCRILSTDIISGTDIHGKTKFDYTNACSKQLVYGNSSLKDVCSSICEEHQCCLGMFQCPSKHECWRYEPCAILKELDEYEYYYEYYEEDDGNDKGNDNDGVSLEALKGICKKDLVLSQDSFFTKSCVESCEDAKCCFDGSCEFESNYCAQRTACASVSKPSIACSKELMEKGFGLAACENACNIFSCCWDDNNCFATHESECLIALQHCNTKND